MVSFFPEGDTDAMMEALDAALSRPMHQSESATKAIKDGEARLRFMFDRFLIGSGILPTGSIERVEAMPIAAGDVFALSLPETPTRRKTFVDETRPPECKIFDGIRRKPGWIGCGMSYKYLSMSALKMGVDAITVMEDDVLLPVDYQEKMGIVYDFLKNNEEKWDIFCGVVADLNNKTKVIDVQNYRGVDFVTVDKMTSTVFNVYGRRCMEIVSRWNPRIENANYNTIDRFLESSGLRIVLTDPYLVGHREEVHSTLWGFQNSQYRDMISDSQRRLNVLKQEWLKENAGVSTNRVRLATA
jgi:hypothetical protein